jgi:hypothetical protein
MKMSLLNVLWLKKSKSILLEIIINNEGPVVHTAGPSFFEGNTFCLCLTDKQGIWSSLIVHSDMGII